MRHLNLELERLEERIAPWSLPSLSLGCGSGATNASNGSDGSRHSKSSKSHKSSSSGSGSSGS